MALIESHFCVSRPAVVALFANSGVFDNKINLFIGLPKKKIIPAKEVRIPFKKLDFVNSRKIMLPIILIVIVGGLTYSLIKGFNFAVDFTGGTSITVNTTDKVSLEGYTIDKINSTKDSTTINCIKRETIIKNYSSNNNLKLRIIRS